MWFLPFLKLGFAPSYQRVRNLPLFSPFFRFSAGFLSRTRLGACLGGHWLRLISRMQTALEDDSFGKRFKHGGCDSLDLFGSHCGFLEPPLNGCLSTTLGPTKRCSSGGPNKKAIETSCRSSTVSGALSGCYPTILIANLQGNGLLSHHHKENYPRRGATSLWEKVEVSIHFLGWIPYVYIYIYNIYSLQR